MTDRPVIIPAQRIVFAQAVPRPGQPGQTTIEVSIKHHADHIRDLLFFPHCGSGSYVLEKRADGHEWLEERVIIAPVRYAELDRDSWLTWMYGCEADKPYTDGEPTCELCQRVFGTAQGLAGHMYYVHGVTKKHTRPDPPKRANPAPIPPTEATIMPNGKSKKRSPW